MGRHREGDVAGETRPRAESRFLLHPGVASYCVQLGRAEPAWNRPTPPGIPVGVMITEESPRSARPTGYQAGSDNITFDKMTAKVR